MAESKTKRIHTFVKFVVFLLFFNAIFSAIFVDFYALFGIIK